jgi:hypothetical protein
MNCVDEATLTDMLREAGFEAMARFWQVDSFLAIVAEKRKRRRRRRWRRERHEMVIRPGEEWRIAHAVWHIGFANKSTTCSRRIAL